MTRRFSFLAAFAALAALSSPLTAQEPTDPAAVEDPAPAASAEEMAAHTAEETARNFVEAFNADTLAVLTSETEDADAALRDILKDRMAIEYLSRVLVGDARRSASEDQLAAYEAVFPTYIANVYAGQLKQLGDKTFEVTRAAQTRPREIIVRTEYQVENRPKPVAVDWRLRLSRDKSEVKLVDAAVKGVSTVLLERDTFQSIVRNEGFDALVALLEAKAADAVAPNVDIEADIN